MTDAEWRMGEDPRPLLRHLNGQASQRRYRLFACACCRRIWDRFPDAKNQRLIEVVEDHPEGRFQDPVLNHAICESSCVDSQSLDQQAFWVAKYLGRSFYKLSPAQGAMVVVQKIFMVVGALSLWPEQSQLEQGYSTWAPDEPAYPLGQFGPVVQAEGKHQADLLRDIFGNPFCTRSSLHPKWLDWNDALIVGLAQTAAEHRTQPAGLLDPDRLAVLADALEDAGCVDAEILGHLREPGPHVRGCWVLDLILGKQE